MADSQLANVRLITCVGVETELAHLPHFLAHYRALGIPRRNFHVILNTTDDNSPALARARRVLVEYDLPAADVWLAAYTSEAMWAKRREVQARVASDNDWVISADVDEFHEYPAPLAPFLAECERRGANCVQGVFIDRLAPRGALAPVSPTPKIQAQYPLQADVQCPIAGTGQSYNFHGTVKLMAFGGTVWPDKGGHLPMGNEQPVRYLFGRNLSGFPAIGSARFRFFVPLRVHHFKWTERMPATLRQRLATPGVSAAGAEYGRTLLDYLDRSGGIALADIALRRRSRANRRTWRARVAALKLLDAGLWYRARFAKLTGKLLARGAS